MNGKRVMKTKQPVALVALLVLLCCTVAGTLAYLVDKSGPVTNTFEPAYVTTKVKEDFDGTTKSNVKIQNTGNIDAYIRATVVVNWASDSDKEKNVVSGIAPVKDTDYKITYNTSGWYYDTETDYWYCTTAVPSKEQVADEKDSFTPILITKCELAEGANVPDGYHLQVTILADGIQSVPADAVRQAWGVTVDSSGQLTAGTSN